ncbi:MAG: SPASM domain-containing protein [Planctomycetota bacterium]|nr:SPASM domain-containing protein [Planctomycetota bacterium]
MWSGRDVGKVSERFIDSVIQTIIYGRAAMCTNSQRCANAHVLEFNGDLYACDHFVLADWRIGNIMDRPLAELLLDTKLEKFAELKTELPAACKDCEFLRYCWGGCPKHHVPIGGGPERVNHFCEGYKMFFKAALPELNRIAAYVKDGRLPETGGRQRTTAGRVGRNEPCPCGSGRKFKNCCGRSAGRPL